MGPKVDFAPGANAYCSAAIKDGEFNKGLNKLFKSHPKDFAVRQKLTEIFIVRALQDPQTHTGKTRQCVRKNTNFEIRNGMTCRGCASQKCSNLVDRKSFDFFADHAGKIPSISPFYP